ncbi:MAG: hypothetical protein VB934_03690, partial [Polyangiaceae bacterium]
MTKLMKYLCAFGALVISAGACGSNVEQTTAGATTGGGGESQVASVVGAGGGGGELSGPRVTIDSGEVVGEQAGGLRIF